MSIKYPKGTVVRCMEGYGPDLEEGSLHEVLSDSPNRFGNIQLMGGKGYWWNENRFERVTAELVKEETALSSQVGGDHYTKRKIQPFEYSMGNGLDPMQHTIIKYVTRFRDKGGVLDLQKAKHTIDLLIEYEEAK